MFAHILPELREMSVKMITLPLQHMAHGSYPPPLPLQVEKTTLWKLSGWPYHRRFKQGELAEQIACTEELVSEACGASFVTPVDETKKTLARIYSGILDLDAARTSLPWVISFSIVCW